MNRFGRFGFVAGINRGRKMLFMRRLRGRPDIEAKMLPDLVNEIVVQRAGVGELLENTHIRECFQYLLRLHLELPGQLIDSNLLHI